MTTPAEAAGFEQVEMAMAHVDKKHQDAIARCLSRAEAGDPEAQFELGLRFASGSGGRLDYVAAHKWFNLAAMRGVRKAIDERSELSREMTPAEIAAAQRAAREWLGARPH